MLREQSRQFGEDGVRCVDQTVVRGNPAAADRLRDRTDTAAFR
jgi:hypothetical protein